MTLKEGILHFLTTCTQLTARHKNFLRGCLLVFGLKEGLVRQCALKVRSYYFLFYSPNILPKNSLKLLCKIVKKNLLRKSNSFLWILAYFGHYNQGLMSEPGRAHWFLRNLKSNEKNGVSWRGINSFRLQSQRSTDELLRLG